jgi:hypothetical protein
VLATSSDRAIGYLRKASLSVTKGGSSPSDDLSLPTFLGPSARPQFGGRARLTEKRTFPISAMSQELPFQLRPKEGGSGSFVRMVSRHRGRR